MRLIFLKKDPSLFAKLIRWWTWSPYCHCELLFSDGSCYSAAYTRGTRFASIDPTAQLYWDVLEISMSDADEQKLRLFCVEQLGSGYDWWGILVSQVFGLRRSHTDKWFCSELCASALKLGGVPLTKPDYAYSPGGLFTALRKLNARLTLL